MDASRFVERETVASRTGRNEIDETRRSKGTTKVNRESFRSCRELMPSVTRGSNDAENDTENGIVVQGRESIREHG